MEATLKKIFGFTDFRPHQREIVQSILDGRDVFAVMPTGGGKSLCYLLPALLKPGLCLVISPLISLMKDQVDNAREVGIRAAFLNSTQSPDERRQVVSAIHEGELDVLYVAPERLSTRDFQEFVAGININFVAVDEAHCVSEWGHDFRPDYLALSNLKKIVGAVPVAAFTATATRKVQDDIVDRLRLDHPYMVRASFDRPNLFYKVEAKDGVSAQVAQAVLQFKEQPGIVYRLSRKGVESTAAYLQKKGINAAPYHAGLSPQVRQRHQEQFNRDQIQVIVATIAFGMGIDKANVRFVIHGDLPKNIEGYYQETGRAGRDGDLSHCILFYSRGDMAKLGSFIDQHPDKALQKVSWQKLGKMADFAEKAECRRVSLLGYFQEVYPHDNCGACDVCMQGVDVVDGTTEAQMFMSAIYRTQERFGVGHILDIIMGAKNKRILQLGHEALPTHGVGKHLTRSFWRRFSEGLLAEGLLESVGDQFKILQITAKGQGVLYGKSGYTYAVLKGEKKKPPSKNVDEKGYNTDLFSLLKEVRTRLSDAADVPPYVVFADKSLRQMCLYYPQTEGGMLGMHGVGTAKMAKYGHDFLAEIKKYVEANPECLKASGVDMPVVTTVARLAKDKDGGSSETIQATIALLEQGQSLADIVAERGLKLTTISSHVEAYLAAGHSLNLEHLLDTAQQHKIETSFTTHGLEFLKPVVAELDVTYEQAKIVRGLIRGRANSHS
ncbi:MAG: DNA helicase RecQ [Desulfobulbaceae bacterium]|nr:DNA helicase RecQ [Desulfobulbaceae bacterium]